MADGDPRSRTSVVQSADAGAPDPNDPDLNAHDLNAHDLNAHDLSNLLGAVLNYAELVADGLEVALARPDADPTLTVALADTHEIVRVTRLAADLVHQSGPSLGVRAASPLTEGTAPADESHDADRARPETRSRDH